MSEPVTTPAQGANSEPDRDNQSSVSNPVSGKSNTPRFFRAPGGSTSSVSIPITMMGLSSRLPLTLIRWWPQQPEEIIKYRFLRLMRGKGIPLTWPNRLSHRARFGPTMSVAWLRCCWQTTALWSGSIWRLPERPPIWWVEFFGITGNGGGANVLQLNEQSIDGVQLALTGQKTEKRLCGGELRHHGSVYLVIGPGGSRPADRLPGPQLPGGSYSVRHGHSGGG